MIVIFLGFVGYKICVTNLLLDGQSARATIGIYVWCVCVCVCVLHYLEWLYSNLIFFCRSKQLMMDLASTLLLDCGL